MENDGLVSHCSVLRILGVACLSHTNSRLNNNRQDLNYKCYDAFYVEQCALHHTGHHFCPTTSMSISKIYNE